MYDNIPSIQKLNINRVVHTFEPYMQNSPDFKIVFFPSKGYVWLSVEGSTAEIETVDQIIDLLLRSVICDVALSPYNFEHVDDRLSEREKRQIRLHLGRILDHVPEDQPIYFRLLEEQMKTYPENPGHDSEEENDAQ